MHDADSTDAIGFDRIDKTFARGRNVVEALRGVSLSIRHGEFVTVLGPSGCGKSTLLHIAGGFERPTSGVAYASGKPIAGPGRDRGVVFQNATLLPWKNVLKNVSWSMEVADQSKRSSRARARELLHLVGLRGFEDSYPSELSGGMRQRAALARTLALNPSVMLMDEPFGALDALTREVMQEELNRIWQESSITVLFITHDIHEAIFLGDRVAVMTARPGRIVKTVEIDLPRPRMPDVKVSPEVLRYHNRFWEMLREQGAFKRAEPSAEAAAYQSERGKS